MNRFVRVIHISAMCFFMFLARPVMAADHMNHGAAHTDMPKGAKGPSAPLPLITIVSPKDGSHVPPTVVVDFETTGDLASMTMGSKKHGNHLHFSMDELTLMPVMKDLKSLGENRYRFVFELPVKPGKHEIKVYWSDGHHKTLEHTVQKISVTVDKPSTAK